MIPTFIISAALFAVFANANPTIECNSYAFCTPVAECDEHCLLRDSAYDLLQVPIIPAEVFDIYLPLTVAVSIWVMGICLILTTVVAMCAMVDEDDE